MHDDKAGSRCRRSMIASASSIPKSAPISPACRGTSRGFSRPRAPPPSGASRSSRPMSGRRCGRLSRSYRFARGFRARACWGSSLHGRQRSFRCGLSPIRIRRSATSACCATSRRRRRRTSTGRQNSSAGGARRSWTAAAPASARCNALCRPRGKCRRCSRAAAGAWRRVHAPGRDGALDGPLRLHPSRLWHPRAERAPSSSHVEKGRRGPHALPRGSGGRPRGEAA